MATAYQIHLIAALWRMGRRKYINCLSENTDPPAIA